MGISLGWVRGLWQQRWAGHRKYYPLELILAMELNKTPGTLRGENTDSKFLSTMGRLWNFTSMGLRDPKSDLCLGSFLVNMNCTKSYPFMIKRKEKNNMEKIIDCKYHKKSSKMIAATCTNDTEIKCTSPALYCKICAIKYISWLLVRTVRNRNLWAELSSNLSPYRWL